MSSEFSELNNSQNIQNIESGGLEFQELRTYTMQLEEDLDLLKEEFKINLEKLKVGKKNEKVLILENTGLNEQ